jgi:hypothetical protein
MVRVEVPRDAVGLDPATDLDLARVRFAVVPRPVAALFFGCFEPEEGAVDRGDEGGLAGV